MPNPKLVYLATGMIIGYSWTIIVFWNDLYEGGDTIEKKMAKKWWESWVSSSKVAGRHKK